RSARVLRMPGRARRPLRGAEGRAAAGARAVRTAALARTRPGEAPALQGGSGLRGGGDRPQGVVRTVRRDRAGGHPHRQRRALDGTPWPAAVSYCDGRWAKAFDRTSPFDDALLLGEGSAREEPPAPTPAVASSPSRTPAAAVRCAEAARERSATLERFDQWDS